MEQLISLLLGSWSCKLSFQLIFEFSLQPELIHYWVFKGSVPLAKAKLCQTQNARGILTCLMTLGAPVAPHLWYLDSSPPNIPHLNPKSRGNWGGNR